MDNLSLNKLWKYGVVSGILIGLICLLPIIGGWDDYVRQIKKDHGLNDNGSYYKFYPLTRILSSLFFWVVAGTLMCWLISRFVSSRQNNKKYKKIIIFLIGGSLTAIAIQLAARDALIFDRASMEQGKGGPLGEPSFETIGNFFAAGFIYVGIYVLFLKSADVKSFFRTNYLSTLTLAVMSYGAIFLLWYSITNGDQPPKEGIKAYIFEPSFPHHERIFLLPLMISILFIVYYFGIKKINKKEFDVAISYSHEDADFTNELYDNLTENSMRVYKDDEYMADVVGRTLDEYLYTIFRYRCAHGLIIVSKNYLTSKYGTKELAALKERCVINKDIILPIIIDGTKLNELGLPEDLVYLNAQKLTIDKIAAIITLKVKPKPPRK